MQLNLIAFLALAAAAVLFALQNSTTVTVVFLVWRFEASLALVLIVCVALGATLSALLALPGVVRGGLRSRQQQNRIRELERAIEAQPGSSGRPGAAVSPALAADSPQRPPTGAPR